ncbi:hypothetical protein [Actinokineospora alba]|uniref:hypothetical protein n=1 Tax=Actinokineospora alba TaxID=504798 RepID=UPI0015A44A8F|nr:hypothetical protein [Actinokineospora alba]
MEAVAGLDATRTRTVVETVSRGRKGLSMLHRHLTAHPDALISGESDCSTVFLRLVNTLIDTGYRVTPLRCVGCGRHGLTLASRVEGGRMCGTCANRRRAQLCRRCGLIRTVYARVDGDAVCVSCYSTDPTTGTRCSACGVLARIARRTPCGDPLCESCYQPPTQPCIHCGHIRIVSMRTDAGPVCSNCRRHPPRRCAQCGRNSKIVTKTSGRELCRDCFNPATGRCDHCGNQAPLITRRSSDTGALCRTCYSRAPAECSGCGQLRRCRRSKHPDAPVLCGDCRPTWAERCARCGRAKRILATWPIGRVCASCYAYVRKHPATCGLCGLSRPLIGQGPAGQSICGPCAGRADLDYTCPRCGESGFAPTAGTCLRCAVADRVIELLRGPNNAIPDGLRPFATALTEVDSPEAILHWLRPGQPAAHLLAAISVSQEPVTHDLLDDFPPGLAVHRLRQTLVHTGILTDRADYLERIEPWLDRQLADQPADHAQLIRTYTNWVLLRRARQRTNASQPFTPGAANWARTRIFASLRLLEWLRQHNLDLGAARQDDIDTWLTTGKPESTYPAREFLHWAKRRRLTTVAIPKKQHQTALAPITEDERWHQLRRCLHDTTLPTAVRAAGALVLLYGLPVSRVTTLRHNDIQHDPTGQTWLRYGGHRLQLPPAVATLILNQRDGASTVSVVGRSRPQDHQWLFPGGFPGRPARDAIYRALRSHLGLHLRRARSAALASLAAQIPAAVLAQLLDININTAIAWANYAQHDWTTYLTARNKAAANHT